MFNGRINIINQPPHTNELFKLYDNCQLMNQEKFFKDSELEKIYLSQNNIRLVESKLRDNVYKLTNNKYVIDRQCLESLKTIMEDVMEKNTKYICTNPKEKTDELNNIVINTYSPKIVNEINYYIKYKYDVSTLKVPIDLPLTNNKDTSLEYKPF